MLLYGLLAILLTWPLALQWTTHLPGRAHRDGLEDAYQNVWNLWWMKEALYRGLNPLITDRLFHPERPNLYYHTLSPINTLLAVPVTARWGPIAGFNAVAFASFVIGGLGAWALARDRTGCGTAAILAGVIYAWSPFHMAALVEDGQMQIVALQWLPFYVLFLLRAIERGERRDILAASLFLALTAWTDWYYTLFLLVFTAGYAVWRLVARAQNVYDRLALIVRLAVIGGLAALGAAPLLAPMFVEAARADYMYIYPPDDPERLSADLLAYVLPARLHPWWNTAITGWETSHAVNRRLYLGGVAAGLALLGFWRRPEARRWGIVALSFAILSLGPTLRVGGMSLGLPLPYHALANLPLVQLSRQPDRFAVLVTLALAVMAAYGATAIPLVRRMRLGPVLWLALGAMLVVDYMPAPIVTREPVIPPFFHSLPAADDGALLEYPFHVDVPYRDAERMLFQTIHGRPTSAGYHSRHYPQLQLGLPVLRDLNAGLLASDIVVEKGGWRPALAQLGYRYIIGYKQQPRGPRNLTPVEADIFRTLSSVGLGVAGPTYEDGWLIVYHVPEASPAPIVAIREGWGIVEGSAEGRYRWMKARGSLGLFAPSSGLYRLSWSSLPAGGSRTLVVKVGAQTIRVRIAAKERRYHILLNLPEGASRLELTAVEPPTTGNSLHRNGDMRPITVRFADITLDEVEAPESVAPHARRDGS